MTRLIFIISILLLFSTTIFAQDIQGKVVYKVVVDMKNSVILSNNKNDAATKKLIKDMRKKFESTYVLRFNTDESIYQEDKSETQIKVGSVQKFSSSSDGKLLYKNLKENIKVQELDLSGKSFLVTDSLKPFVWELKNETKKIGNYICKKAIFTSTITKRVLSNSETNVEEPKEQISTVWYTPEIPVSHGPSIYYGLPGLIMEVNFLDTTISCTEVVLNPKHKIKIKRPKRGHKITNEEFHNLSKKNWEKLQLQKGTQSFKVIGR